MSLVLGNDTDTINILSEALKEREMSIKRPQNIMFMICRSEETNNMFFITAKVKRFVLRRFFQLSHKDAKPRLIIISNSEHFYYHPIKNVYRASGKRQQFPFV